ncbi:LamB/YcsF family protein [bacterium]|nr:LamB/YcsF family protein [bacterium]
MQKNNDKKNKSIDFSCDLAQGFGIYKNELELDFLDCVSSVNIAAGLHSGDPLTIQNALLKAKEKNVVIGANIGFNDREGFGLRPMQLSYDEIESLVIYQIGAIDALAKSNALEIEFVRPHGAMYKMAAENYEFSCAIARAIKKYSKWLSYVGAANDTLDKVGEDVCLTVVKEIQLDKNYKSDKNIDYEKEDLTDVNAMRLRFQKYMNYSQLTDVDGNYLDITADSVHFATNAISLELIKSLSEIYPPLPVNYMKAQASGWV